jgi:uncharacterized Zn-finger protein
MWLHALKGRPKRSTCPDCGKDFNRKYMTSHRRLHAGERPRKCDDCGEAFVDASGLAHHRARRHTERAAVFACDSCDLLFHYKQALETHERVHTGARPFVCDACQKSFSDRSNFRRHQRSHARNSLVARILTESRGKAAAKMTPMEYLKLSMPARPPSIPECSAESSSEEEPA